MTKEDAERDLHMPSETQGLFILIHINSKEWRISQKYGKPLDHR